MNFFSRKQEIRLLAVTAFLFVLGVLLIMFSDRLIAGMYVILSQNVFHREFSIDKWAPTISSFLLLPLFVIIAFTAAVFPKYTDRTKKIFLLIFLGMISVIIVYACYTTTMTHMNSDLASEMLLAGECVREKSPVPAGWCYSTEIRLLNMQLIAAPLFALFSDWNLVKTLTSIFGCAVLCWSFLFLMRRTGGTSPWVKLLCAVLIVCPWSGAVWYVITWGNYYIPHVVISFLYIAFFLDCIADDTKKNVRRCIPFFVMAFISGLSSIRYILIFQAPLMFAVALPPFVQKLRGNDGAFDAKRFFFSQGPVRCSITGFLLGGIGYLCNTFVLQRVYSFSQWNTTTFNALGDVTWTDILRAILTTFGYTENISVFTPGGIVNIFVVIGLIVFIALLIESFKTDITPAQRLVLSFFVSAVVFNTFVYMNTEFIGRFYVPILIYFVPCFWIIVSNVQIHQVKRYVFAVLWTVVLLTSSFVTVQKALVTDENSDKYPVVSFLQNHGYTFGYATFWNANVVTALTEGDIEVGNIWKKKETAGICRIADSYKYDAWLTPERYYRDGFKDKEKVFFLVSTSEYNVNRNNSVFSAGSCVYTDEHYYVYEYPSHTEFKAGFGH